MKDWKAIAKAAGLDAPEAELEQISQTLAGLERTFRPLLRELSPEMEPVTTFHISMEAAE